MENILRLYAKPLDRYEPVICLDEKPVQLLADVKPTHRQNGVLKRDYEYKRMGTRNIFCMVDPKAGKHFEKVTKKRGQVEFAHVMRSIAKLYPRARVIHCVMDNLSTHSEKALREYPSGLPRLCKDADAVGQRVHDIGIRTAKTPAPFKRRMA